MTERQKIIALVLAILVLTGIAVLLWLPSRSVKGSVDFGIHDENSNFHYEVGEELALSLVIVVLFEAKTFSGSWAMVTHCIVIP